MPFDEFEVYSNRQWECAGIGDTRLGASPSYLQRLSRDTSDVSISRCRRRDPQSCDLVWPACPVFGGGHFSGWPAVNAGARAVVSRVASVVLTLLAVIAIFRLKMSVMTVLLGTALLSVAWAPAGMR